MTNQSNYSSFGNDFLSPGLGIVEAEPGVFYGIAIKGGDHDQGVYGSLILMVVDTIRLMILIQLIMVLEENQTLL